MIACGGAYSDTNMNCVLTATSATVNNAACANTLTLCKDSCSSGVRRDGVTTPFAIGATENWVSCYNTSTTCSASTSNQGGGWTSTDSGKVGVVGGFPTVVTGIAAGTADISDTVTAEGTASGMVNVPAPPAAACGPAAHTYPSNAPGLSGAYCGAGSTIKPVGSTPTLPADATPVSWTCEGAAHDTTNCTANRVCSTNCPTEAANHCGPFTTTNSCGITENCTGTKTNGCNLNWTEVAP